ncbi:uncharacterized protein LODBEIA_P48250 [Lodderomyces beijingensis]|uniref:5'-3' exoribonuclease n=1 Tax=Lodderomyces beijingensis TaxID=1775926 RepID=A0ABP0ZR11_9ASCO
MGVPALFRWLSRKYPKIISSVIEADEDEHDGIGGAKYSEPNPNGEVDNLYLDMNGIVHPCSHPEHKRAPETEDEMFLDIFAYTDRVLMMARPRKVLMIAVDGVAPRAKMNQQRARRFRSAQDAKIKDLAIAKEIREKEARGEMIDEAVKGKKQWDSNAITPGTPFMDRLAEALRYWVAYKLASDPGWANLQVIISDATVPGEGEHKLMSFIRSQRSDPSYNPNTRHCIYGLDADLIFLGLATHEPHFRVLREDVFANQEKRMTISDHIAMSRDQADLIQEKERKKPFLWLHVNVLREYLSVELQNPRLSFPFDLERAIDDWVFICFFAGNDFLPHLPSLDVRDNGIDTLVNCWKKCLPRLRDYVTCDGKLNLESVETLMADLANKEGEIFQSRFRAEQRREENRKRRKLADEQDRALKNIYLSQVSKGREKAPLQADVNMPLMDTSGHNVEGFAPLSNKDIVHNLDTITKAGMANHDAAAALKKLIDSRKSSSSKEDTPVDSSDNTSATNTDREDAVRTKKRTLGGNDETQEETEVVDGIRLHEPGYQKRYYQVKFHCKTDEEVEETKRQVVKSYVEGISWVALYYYQGCPSWNWFYPYHYAPFAGDMTNLKELFPEGVKFNLGKPFKPYEQLMSVLPAASSHALPEVFHPLMKDPDSEVIDFYPEEFEIDMNGKKMSWQGIPLLPFIDETRLLASVQAKYDQLTEYESNRNVNKEAELFISSENKNYKTFSTAFYDKESEDTVDFKFAKTGLAGVAIKMSKFEPRGVLDYPLKEGQMPNVEKKDYLQVEYHFPLKKRGKSMLLNGFISPHAALTVADRNEILYKLDSGDVRGRGGYHNNNHISNNDYINRGPVGTEIFKTYGMRKGGYRSHLHMMKNQASGTNMGGNMGAYVNTHMHTHTYTQMQSHSYMQPPAQYGRSQYGQNPAFRPNSRHSSQNHHHTSNQHKYYNNGQGQLYTASNPGFLPPKSQSGRNGYRS